MSSVGRTGPQEKAEEKGTWRKENVEAKEECWKQRSTAELKDDEGRR